MTDYNINIVINPAQAVRGGRRVEQQLERISNSADRTRQLIARAFTFAGLALGIRQLTNLVDTFTNMQNRLRIITRGTAELAVVTGELFDIADRTRVNYESTAELYARMGIAARELGASQQELLNFTESLNKAVILSGASVREANAGFIQLSQGLASGALRGDELRSVLEQLPVVADVIAKELGVTRGALRDLGAEGKITASVVLRAFANARQEIGERFAKTVPTVGQSLTVLYNNVLELVGGLDRSTGASTLLAKGILYLSDNLEDIARVALAATMALGVYFAVKGVGAAVSAMEALTMALVANPFTALAVAVTATAALLVAFSDRISVGAGRLANLQDLGRATFEALTSVVDAFVRFFDDNFGFVADFMEETFGNVELSVEGVLRTTARVVDGIVGFFKGAADAVTVAFDNVPAALEAVFVRAFEGIMRLYVRFTNFLIDGLNRIATAAGVATLDKLDEIQLPLSNRAKVVGKSMDQAIADGIAGQSAAEDALDGILARAEDIARERLDKQRKAQSDMEAARQRLNVVPSGGGGPSEADKANAEFEKLLEATRREGELLRLSNQEREVQQGLLAAEKTLKRELTVLEERRLQVLLEYNQRLADERAMYDEIRGPTQEYERRMAALNRLLESGSISTEEFTQKQRELRIQVLDSSKDLESGVERGLLKMQDQFTDVASVAEDAMTNAFQGAEDAIVEFVRTGKLEVSDLVDSIAADLTRLAVRQAITAPLAQALGLNGASGGASIFGTLFSSGGTSGGGGGGGGDGGAAAASTIFSLFSSLIGFADGGDFMVGGRPGVDRNILAINGRPVAKVSKGETVSVANNGGGGRPIQVNFSVNTPSGNVPRQTQEQMAARAAQAIQRADRRNN